MTTRRNSAIIIPGLDPYSIAENAGVKPVAPVQYDVVDTRKGNSRTIIDTFKQIAPIDVANLMAYGMPPWGVVRRIEKSSV